MEASRKAALERHEALAMEVERAAAGLLALTDGLGGGSSAEAVRTAVAQSAAAAARRVAGECVEAHAKDQAREQEARWKVRTLVPQVFWGGERRCHAQIQLAHAQAAHPSGP
jgi:hypothetical protein